MLKITGGQFIDIVQTQGYDNMGQPEVSIAVQGNIDLIDMQTDIISLKTDIEVLKNQQREEERLRAEHPALKDIHDQYQVVLKLVQTADNNLAGTEPV